MNLFTHLFMAHVIRREIRMHSGARLNYIGFLYGNILPDISEFYLKIPHYKKYSFSFIKKKSEEITNRNKDDLSYNSFYYAKNLGVISHYITDYFCYAHTPDFTGNIFKHFMYEMYLMPRLPKGIKIYKLRYSKDNDFIDFSDVESLCDKHNKEEQSYVGDINNALFVSTKFSSSLVARTILCQEAEAFSYNYDGSSEQTLIGAL